MLLVRSYNQLGHCEETWIGNICRIHDHVLCTALPCVAAILVPVFIIVIVLIGFTAVAASVAVRIRKRFGRSGCSFLKGLVIAAGQIRSEEHTSELQSLMRHPYAVFCFKKHTYRT